MCKEILNDISNAIYEGQTEKLFEKIDDALFKGVGYEDIVHDGLMAGLERLNRDYNKGKIYMADMLSASASFQMGCSMLLNCHCGLEHSQQYKVIMGTVRGDIHELGKNLTRYIIQSKGVHVVNLGTNVDAQSFAEVAQDRQTAIILCSATLHVSARELKNIVKAVKEVRKDIPIFTGGSAFSDRITKEAGADGYFKDAFESAKTVLKYILKKERCDGIYDRGGEMVLSKVL